MLGLFLVGFRQFSFAVSFSLFRRERTGEGSDISVAMSEVMRSFILVEHGAAAVPEPPLGGAGYPRILTPERRPQPTADGLINVLPYDARHYQELFRLGGRPDLVDDPRIATRKSRLAHGGSLYRDVAAILRERTTAEWMMLMRAAGIPATPVATIDELLDDLPIVEHPTAGRYRATPALTGQAATAEVVRRPAPLHGEHGREVLASLGYSETELDGMEESGALFRGVV